MSLYLKKCDALQSEHQLILIHWTDSIAKDEEYGNEEIQQLNDTFHMK